jgi:predicted HAD superfamily Cof-like phosphohydrolase
MTNPFRDQAKFMNACGQTVGNRNQDQFDLYLKLIQEEVEELQTAVNNNDRVEQLDALIDILVVTVGAVQSLGVDGEGAWKEVMITNFAKIDSLTGRVRKREDGKDWEVRFDYDGKQYCSIHRPQGAMPKELFIKEWQE